MGGFDMELDVRKSRFLDIFSSKALLLVLFPT